MVDREPWQHGWYVARTGNPRGRKKSLLSFVLTGISTAIITTVKSFSDGIHLLFLLLVT